jgi:CheY-like chemotaxis protein
VKFTEQGSINVRVDLLQRSNEQVELEFVVADTGIGIPAENLPDVFDNFTQAGVDTARKYGGTGLGLAICKQLLQLQGGSIALSSEEGKGSVFSFRIPYGNSEREEPGTVAAGITDHSQLLAGRRFLVAEDNEVNQKLVEYVLNRAGGIVQLAGNGNEAVNLLQQDKSYDLIIMDLQMPVMDGYGATQVIRDEMRLDTPIIAMTATALVGEQVRCLDAGIDEYMTKPFDFKELYKKIGLLLDKPGPFPLDLYSYPETQSAYDLGLLRQMDDRQYLWDRLNVFILDTPGRISEMRTAVEQGDTARIIYLASRIKRGARVLQAQVMLGLLDQIIVLGRIGGDVLGLIQMVQAVYEGLVPQLQAEKERVGFVLSF